MLKIPRLIRYAFGTGSSYRSSPFSPKKFKHDATFRNPVKPDGGMVRLIGQIGLMLLLFLIYLVLVGGTEILLFRTHNF